MPVGSGREMSSSNCLPEDVSFRHITERLPAGDVHAILTESFAVEVEAFKRRCRYSPLWAVVARSLMHYAGLSQRDVADLLKVGSGAAVCNQINRLPEKLAKDRQLRRQVKQAEEALSMAYHQKAKKTNGPSL